MTKLIATFDIGTTSVKVSLFTHELKQVACYVKEYSLNTNGSYVEADPSIYKEAIMLGLNQCREAISNSVITAIGITTQGETLIPVDQSGTPLYPAIVWLDSRAKEQAMQLREKLSLNHFYRITGLPDISGALPIAKIMWLQQEHPEIYANTYKFLLLEDYILHWLTGMFVTERTLLTSTGYFNLSTDDYWDESLQAAGIDKLKLPKVLEAGSLVGILTKEAADQLELSTETLVVTGAMDQIASALAVGCINPGMITETTGTALVVAACTDNPVFAQDHRVTIYRHALPGRFLYLPIGNTAGMALKWFKDEFCKDLCNEKNIYPLLDELVNTISPGSEGLLFLPFLCGSVDPENNPDAKGVFFGAQLSTNRNHFIRSIMEAIGYLLKDFLLLCERLGCKPEKIYSLGGGSRSELWQQIKADCTGKPLTVLEISEASSAGAALLAAWGSGIYERGKLPPYQVMKCYHPNPKLQELYQSQYQKYCNLYQAVKPYF